MKHNELSHIAKAPLPNAQANSESFRDAKECNFDIAHGAK